MFEIIGRGVFTTEQDIALGMALADNLKNEGFYVTTHETRNLLNSSNITDTKAYIVDFTSKSNNIPLIQL